MWITIIDLLRQINPYKILRSIRQTDKIEKLAQENIELKQKVSKFENPDATQKELEFRGNIYYRKATRETFCFKCWDSDKKVIHLVDGGDPSYWHCNNCDEYYKKLN